MTKKAQIQNMETITVIIIIMLLITFGLVYASSQRRESIKEEQQQIKDLEVMTITTNILNLDFVKCTESEIIIYACVDYYKIKALAEKTRTEENYLHFYRIFGESDIKIKIYRDISFPNHEFLINQNITIYNITNTENMSQKLIRTPIIIRDSVLGLNYFGIMEVIAYR